MCNRLCLTLQQMTCTTQHKIHPCTYILLTTICSINRTESHQQCASNRVNRNDCTKIPLHRINNPKLIFQRFVWRGCCWWSVRIRSKSEEIGLFSYSFHSFAGKTIFGLFVCVILHLNKLTKFKTSNESHVCEKGIKEYQARCCSNLIVYRLFDWEEWIKKKNQKVSNVSHASSIPMSHPSSLFGACCLFFLVSFFSTSIRVTKDARCA